LRALGCYHAKLDPARKIDLGPDHDWASHSADAFGLMCITYEEPAAKKVIDRHRRRSTSDTSWMTI